MSYTNKVQSKPIGLGFDDFKKNVEKASQSAGAIANGVRDNLYANIGNMLNGSMPTGTSNQVSTSAAGL